MSNTMKEFEAAIVAAINEHQRRTVSGYTICINEKSSGPRPTEPFASFRTLDYQGQDYPSKDYVGDPEEIITDTPYIPTQIKFVGLDAFPRLVNFCIALRSANRFKDLYKVVGLGGIEGPQNISISDENGRILEQAVATVSFYAEISSSEQIDAIDNGQVELIVKSPIDETITIETEITE
jgi:hypothetical protein